MDDFDAAAGVVANGGNQQSKDPFDSAASIVADAQRKQAALAVAFGSSDTQDQAAWDNAVAKRFGTTPDVVSQYRDEFKNNMTAQDAESILNSSPQLQQYLANNPQKAGIYHPDLANTAQTEQVLKAWTPSYGERLNLWLRQVLGLNERDKAKADIQLISQETGTPVSQLRQAVGGMSEVPEQLVGKAVNTGSFGLIPDVAGDAQTTAGQVAGGVGDLVGFMGGPVKAAEYGLGKLGFNSLLQVNEADSFLKALGKTVASQAGTLGVATGLQNIGEAINSPDVTTGLEKEGKAVLGGAATGAVFGAAGKFLPDNTIAQFAGRALFNNVANDLVSGKAPFSDITNWDQLTDEQKVNTVFNYGLNTLFSLQGGGRTKGGWFKDAADADMAGEDAAKINELTNLATGNKARMLDPEGYKQIINSVVQDGDVKNLYVDGQVFMQSMAKTGTTLDQLQDLTPDVAKQLTEANETNGMISIPVADYMTHIAGGPLGNEIQPHLKIDPDGMSISEAQDFQQKQIDSMLSEAKDLSEKQQQTDEWQASKNQVRDQILEQLNQTNRFRPEVNRAYATLKSEMVGVLAEKMGMTLQEVMDKYGAQVMGEGRGGFNQFAGESSQTADRYALDTAQKRLADGDNPEKVRRETGWFEGADGQWRYEIPDDEAKFKTGDLDKLHDELKDHITYSVDEDGLHKATFDNGNRQDYFATYGKTQDDAKNNLIRNLAKTRDVSGFDINKINVQDAFDYIKQRIEDKYGKDADFTDRYEEYQKFYDEESENYLKRNNNLRLGDVLDHPKLFEAYPELKNVKVNFKPNLEARGSFSESRNEIDIKSSTDKQQMLSTLLHEVQHAIQDREGFARGGNTDRTYTDLVKAAIDDLDKKTKNAIEQWKFRNKDKLDASERASKISRYSLMYQSATRLMEYANRDKPSGVFRLIRNELQWIYGTEFKDDKAVSDLQYAFYEIPKSNQAKRNAFIRNMAVEGSRLIMERIPSDLRKDFENDPRTMKGMIDGLSKAATKARKQLSPLRDLEVQANNVKGIAETHKYSSPYDIYMALHGEVEARNTQARQNMTEEERRNTAPSQTADVPTHHTIIQFGGLDVYAPKSKSGVFNQDGADLLIQHNLSEDNLLHADRMGGIPVPSLAVTKKQHPLSGFGEITLLGNKDLADPKGDAKTKVFGADIYSPRYPNISYKFDKDSLARLNKALAPYRQEGEHEIYGGQITRVDDLTQNEAFKRYADEKAGGEASWGQMKSLAQHMLREAGASEHIFKGFTYNGNRRYIPHTLENVIKELKKDLRSGEGGSFGVGALRAKFTPQFKSIKDIQNNKDRLMTGEDFENVKKEIEDDFFKEVGDLSEYHPSGERFGFADTVIQTLQDAASIGIPRALEENGFKDVPVEKQKDLAEFLTRLRNMPTEYFEAKILRSVGLHEFSGAVVPHDVSQEALDVLKSHGINDIKTYQRDDLADRAAKIGEFDNLFFQQNRGSYNPVERIISLAKDADLSTYLHETGHEFLDIYTKIAAEPDAPESIKNDVAAVMKDFGIDSLEQWHSMSMDEQRPYHEKFAEAFERYLMEGKAPNPALSGIFSRFARWLTAIYKSLSNIGAEISPELRGVFDRMIASEDAIRDAEEIRGYAKLFETKPDDVSEEDWQAIKNMGQQATDDAIADMRSRSLRDMRWIANAKARAIKMLTREAKERRTDIRSQVAGQVMKDPVYQAWQALTSRLYEFDEQNPGKPKSDNDPNKVQPDRDNLFTAIGKLGGLDREEVQSTWGTDPADKFSSGVFGKPVLRKKGKSIDAMAELLGEHGYLTKDEHGKVDTHELEEKFRSGDSEYSDYFDPSRGSREEALQNLADRYGYRLDYRAVERIAGEKAAQTLRERGMTRANGDDPDLVAELIPGFSSGEDLINRVAEAVPPKEAIEAAVDKRMLEEHGELTDPASIERAAEEAIHNEARARQMATGLKVLAKSPIPADKLRAGAKQAADAAIGAKKVGEINPKQYMAAESKSNKEAIKLAPKDPQGAINAQRAALLNNQLVRSALTAQDDIRKILNYLKRFDKKSVLDKLDVDIRDQITDLLDRFDLRQNPTTGPTKEQQNLAMWVESQAALGYTPNVDGALLNPAFRTHYKEMTVDQFRSLHDAVTMMEKIGKDRKQITIDGKKMELRDVIDNNLIPKMQERGEKYSDKQLVEPKRIGVDPLYQVVLDRMGAALRSIRAEFTAQSFKANRYDMHEILGPFHRYIFEPIFGANYKYMDYQKDVSDSFREQAKNLTGMDENWYNSLNDVIENHDLMDNALEQPEKRRLTRGDLIGIALHVGNESNFAKLTKGMGWEPERVWQALHDNMREQDWQAAKALGEAAGKHWNEMDEMNRRLGNTSPDRIEPRPFMTKFGEMPGWYAPVRYDPLRSRLGARKSDASNINPGEGLFDKNYFRADTTTNGSLNARSNYTDFVDISWHTVEQAINDTIRDLAYRESLIDVHKIYVDKEFRAQFMRTYGREEYKALGEWLGRIVNSDVGDEKSSIITKLSGATRRAMVASGIAFRISTMLKHGSSAGLKSIGYFAGGGEKYFAARAKAIALDHEAQVVEALAKSPEIRARAQQQDRDMRERVASMMEPESLHGKAERFGHAGVAALDFLTAVPTFHAAYDWAVTEGIPEKLGGTGEPMSIPDAIKFADSVVREAHGSNIETARSNLINNRSEIVKMLTTLHGFMNNSFGQVLDMYDKARYTQFNKPELMARFVMAAIVPGLITGVIVGAKKDDEAWWEWAAKSIGGELAGMVPLLRDAYNMIVEGFDKSGMPPYVKAANDLHQVGKDIVHTAKGEENKHPIKDVGNVVGYMLPGASQAGATAQFLYDEKTGKQHATTVGQWIRGLMSGDDKENK